MRKISAIRKNSAHLEAGGEPASSLVDVAYIQLEELIVTLKLHPGQVISEAILCKRLGIGRTPIREALQRLTRERLITILPRRGIMVSDVNVKNQLKLLEVRRELERLIARSAARRATTDECKQFREIAETLEKAARTNDEVTFMRMDREFNVLSASAAHNEFTESAMQLLHALSRRFWYIHYKKVADMPLAAKLHADVARAIAARNEQSAMRASDRLMDYLEEFTRATLSTDT